MPTILETPSEKQTSDDASQDDNETTILIQNDDNGHDLEIEVELEMNNSKSSSFINIKEEMQALSNVEDSISSEDSEIDEDDESDFEVADLKLSDTTKK